MKIGEKEIEIKKFLTRKISREFNEILMGDELIETGETPKLNVKNLEKANNFLVLSMTNLTQDEIDEMSQKDFDIILTKINSLNDTPTSA